MNMLIKILLQVWELSVSNKQVTHYENLSCSVTDNIDQILKV